MADVNIEVNSPRCPSCNAPYYGPKPFPESDSDDDAECLQCGHTAPTPEWFKYPMPGTE